ncbi:segregation/condensation protein A [Streptomyces sp. NBC_01304]|uniref:segregation and condensation protein A n=1 Tax=Streptomyces sp. NBC_01304 TaxID=2903818 RepID=UPI003FA3521D
MPEPREAAAESAAPAERAETEADGLPAAVVPVEAPVASGPAESGAPAKSGDRAADVVPAESDVARVPADPGVVLVPAEPGEGQAPAESGDAPTPAEPGEDEAPAEFGEVQAPVESGQGHVSAEPGAGHVSAESGVAQAPAEPGEDRVVVEGEGQAVGEVGDGRFKVRLANFEGPFDLLLQLISKHKMDVTEVALSIVTNEFMGHIRAMGPDWDLDQTTEFLVVAATLLDLKAARLLPSAEVEDEADLALLEARDLLFARLLQYRAYKQIADIFNRRLDEEARRYPRTVGLEPHHAELLPEVVISIGAEGFAKLAVKAMQPKPKPQVYVDHIHAPLVSVREQGEVVIGRLRELGEASFQVLVEDAGDTLTVVARFLALLELYREKAVALDQDEALGELTVRWTGGEGAEPLVTDEFDRPPDAPEDKGKGDDVQDVEVVEESV